MAQEPRGASGLGRNPGSLCFGRRRLGGLGSDHAELEGGQSEEGAERGQETHRPTVGPVRTSLCLHSHEDMITTVMIMMVTVILASKRNNCHF